MAMGEPSARIASTRLVWVMLVYQARPPCTSLEGERWSGLIDLVHPRIVGAYGKAGIGNKTETGNGNWKRKPETENRNGNATSSLLQS